MLRTTAYFLLTLAILALEFSCTTRRMRSDQVLLKKVFIKCANPAINKDEVYNYVKQKPNRKLLGLNVPHLMKHRTSGKRGLFAKNLMANGSGFPLYLHLYNLVNPQREIRRELRRDQRYQKRLVRWHNRQNKRKSRKGSKFEQKKEPQKRKTIGEFLYGIGEPPAILDSSKTHRSAQQIGLYLNNKGYFNSTVRDTIIYPWFQRKRHRKAIVMYIVEPAQPYTIRNISWDIRDPNLVYDVFSDTATSTGHGTLLRSGNNYDVDIFEKERDRITRSLRNNGYYQFSKDYIRYEVDSTLGTHQVDVKVIISKQQYQIDDTTWGELSHQRFYVRNIIVKNLYSLVPTKEDNSNYDTLVFSDVAFLRNKDSVDGLPLERLMRYKPEVLAPRIIMRPGLLYRQTDYEETYRQLISLGVFRQVVIEPVLIGDKMDLVIKLFPLSQQSYTTQVEGTNTGGNLGIGGAFAYQHNNIFRGAELIEFKLHGGTEAQQPIAASGTSTNGGQLAFNTIEAGADASLYIPRDFFPFNYLVSNKRTEENRTTKERRTVFTASFNYQRRIDYDRSIGNLSYGYTFRYKKFSRFAVYPIELNVVKVTPREGLIQLLQNGDPLLQYRFSDHLINDFRLTYVLNTQTPDPKQRHVFYWKSDFEVSGFVPYGIFKMVAPNDTVNGSYRIAGIPFSQYIRLYNDFHYHLHIGSHEELVARLALGLGVPMLNYPTLPLEKSFYGGGANGIRAWEARTLGPGSYIVPADQKYAQFGDVQIEYNVELRFRITKSLNGALFADGGNIWLLRKDDARPGANINTKFYNDLAFGPGVGLRYDLSFFIVRLDWAFKFRDPSYPYGERWYIPGQRKLSSNLNFGINYPF